MAGNINVYAAAIIVAMQGLRLALAVVEACLERKPLSVVWLAVLSACSFSVAIQVWSAA